MGEMHSQMDEKEAPTAEIAALRTQLDELTKKLALAESTIAALQQKSGGRPAETIEDIAPISDLDSTLRRLVTRIAMILQAEKVLMMFFDRENGELIGIQPAFGIDEDLLKMVRMRATSGVSGEVFREGRPTIFHDVLTDLRTQGDPFVILHVQNGVTVPLVIERRDEENRIVDRQTIGVLHAFNKRHGEEFNDEDVRLLERMAKSAASIISNLRLYQEIVEEKQELLHTLESLVAGIMLVTTEGKLTQMNASARAIFGVNNSVLGNPFTEVIRDKSVREMIESSNQGIETDQVEFVVPAEGREHAFNVQSAHVRSEEGRLIGTVAIFNDVTELKNLERMKSAFVATVSHELRTPLTAIKGFVSTLLMDDGFPEEERREFYTIIDHECDRLKRLIDDLLNIARIEAGESLKPTYSDVDVKQLARKVVMIQRQATNRHELILDAEGAIPSIVGDSDKLDQILTNLVGNAIKYSPEGGTVTVSLSIDGDNLLMAIKDQGIGIPKEHVGKVFDRFHRVHTEDNRKIYGTGLGLFLVKHLVEQIHLGRVWADSEVGEGSTFYVSLPLRLDIEKAEALNS
jgi:two-component system phosphate regulon sensor histidine kinase PhoR